jgi:hypothetical protein
LCFSLVSGFPFLFFSLFPTHQFCFLNYVHQQGRFFCCCCCCYCYFHVYFHYYALFYLYVMSFGL